MSLARHVSFWFGLTALYVALHTRLDYFFEHEFFMHRLQHLVLHHLGPFFIALSYPGAALRAGIPFTWRQRWLRPALNTAPARILFKVIFNPVVAVVLFVGLIYFWLLSPIHFKAMLDWRLYRVMNWSMVIDGLLFWWLVLDSRPAPRAARARAPHPDRDSRHSAADHARRIHFLHAARALSHLLHLRARIHVDQPDARSADRRFAAVDSRFDDERDRRVDRDAPLAPVVDSATAGPAACASGTGDGLATRSFYMRRIQMCGMSSSTWTSEIGSKPNPA